MKVTYDRSIDAAYIRFVPEGGDFQVAKTYPCDPLEVAGQINLDFDKSGRLIGIEVLDASKKLAPELIHGSSE